MKTARVSIFGIPAHPVMNDAPGTLLPMVSICDLIALVSGDRSWSVTAFRMLQLGNLSALIAGMLGALDLLRLPSSPEVRHRGMSHAVMMSIAVPPFLFCQWQRRRTPHRPSRFVVLLALAANGWLNVAAVHGARLVHENGVRTHEHASGAPLSAVIEPVTW